MGYALRSGSIRGNSFHPEGALSAMNGILVERAAGALPQTSTMDLFTVTGGHVLVTRIWGLVTVVIGAVANATKLYVNPAGAGADTDISGTVELNAAAVNSILTIAGVFATAMVKTVNLPVASQAMAPFICPPGTIAVNCAGSDGGTGRVEWRMTYVPLQTGASVAAA